jgi:hypothetical protein
MDVHTAMGLGEDHRRRVISDMRHVQVHRSKSGLPRPQFHVGNIIRRLRSTRLGNRVSRPAAAG